MRTKRERIANEKRRYLERIGWYEDRIDSLQRSLKAEEQRKQGVKAIDYRKEQIKGGNKDSWEALIDKTDKYKQDIINTCIKAVELKTEILELINKVDNPRWQLLLTLRYVERLNWDVIEEQMEITQNTRNKFHAQALECVKIPNIR